MVKLPFLGRRGTLSIPTSALNIFCLILFFTFYCNTPCSPRWCIYPCFDNCLDIKVQTPSLGGTRGIISAAFLMFWVQYVRPASDYCSVSTVGSRHVTRYLFCSLGLPFIAACYLLLNRISFTLGLLFVFWVRGCAHPLETRVVGRFQAPWWHGYMYLN